MRRWFMRLLVLNALTLPAMAQELEIIKLQHRSAEQVLPQISPFVEPGGTVGGTGYQIFLRASPKNREQIRDIIAAFDTALRRLMITVKQDGDSDVSSSGMGISGSVGTQNVRIIQPSGNKDRSGATVEIRRGDNVVRGRGYDTHGSTSDRISQQLQVVEGGKAHISIGRSLPLPLRQVVVTPTGAIVSDVIVYHDVGTGFYAAPTVNGDRVTLEISPVHDTARSVNSVNIQRLSTTVSGRLGEWIELGGTNVDQYDSGDSMTQRSSRSTSANQRVLLKVEALQ